VFQLTTQQKQIDSQSRFDLHKVITRAQVLTFFMSLAYSACQRAEKLSSTTSKNALSLIDNTKRSKRRLLEPQYAAIFASLFHARLETTQGADKSIN
jgi:hypothetical protein